MVVEALLAAKALAAFGIDLEVIDARAVRPLDMSGIVDSVRRTGRLIVADTAWKTGGIAGEVVAGVAETAFDALRSPPLRIALPDLPVPTSHHLTRDFYPDALHVARKVAAHLGVDIPDAELVSKLSRSTPHDIPQLDFRGPF
jgi:pyruvate dehydrogenase E1 component beta subunit